MGRRGVELCVLVGVLLVNALVSAESEPNAHAPELDMKDTDGNKVDVYRGFIVTNEDTVSLVPELHATDKDEIGGARFICGYRIYSGSYDIPFEAHVTSHLDGKAKLKVKDGVQLNDLLRNKFKFQIAAYDCGNPTLHSAKAHVVVQLLRLPEPATATPPLPKDVKEFIDKNIDIVDSKKEELRMKSPQTPEKTTAKSPTTVYPKLVTRDNGGEQYFNRKAYIVSLREGTLYDSILKLRPAPTKSKVNICGYEIVTPDVPFTVNELGSIRNTKALEASVQKSYIVSVVAKHCDGLVSQPAIVNIQVSEICSNGWKGLPTNEEYKAGTKAITPFEKTYFDTCSASCSENETMSVTVSLESSSKVSTCEHDTFSIQSQRDACGASKNTVDLLPQGQPWTKNLTEVEGHEAAYKFDGKTAVKVPSDKSNHTLGDFFSITTWMQHGEEKKDGHKEHVLCNADGDGMNRHHYALFVHNCRLVFLLRKEASQVDSLDKFQPAEWRWTIPHVCDSKWHHYAILVTYPHIKLYVDGQMIQTDKSVVEVVDDWAIHTSDKVTFQQLTVGGCWQGQRSKFGQYFTGSLAGLSMVLGTTETERVVKCMNNCGEKLQFHAMDQLSVGMSVSFNTKLTELTIKGNEFEEVKKILAKVGYANTNGNPKPGYRRLHINSNVSCDGKAIPVKEQTVPVLVSAVADPKITIAGLKLKQRTPVEFQGGVDLFTELMILSDPESQLSGQENRINKLDMEDVNTMQEDLKKKLILDRCEVRVDTKMDSDHEKLKLPTSLLVKYLMDTKEFDGGFDITGSESFANYESVIRETFFIKTNVDKTFKGRKFTVKCSNMNGKFISNTFTVEVGVMDDTQQAGVLYSDPKYAHLKAQGASAEANSFASGHVAAVTGTATGTIVAVVIVCLAFLLVVIAVAVIRIKNVQRRKLNTPNVTVEDGPEMEWDNGPLNITVNPLESDALMQQVKTQTENAEDSEEEIMSSDDDDEDTPKDGGLEWDNSSY